MDKLKQAELSEIALEIINLSEEIINDHPRYRTISFMERINIAIKILEIHEAQDYVKLVPPTSSVLDCKSPDAIIEPYTLTVPVTPTLLFTYNPAD